MDQVATLDTSTNCPSLKRGVIEAVEAYNHEDWSLDPALEYCISTSSEEYRKGYYKHECREGMCRKTFKSRQELQRHEDSMHGKATTYYHCSTQGCKHSSTGWLARKCIREDQIKEHIKGYGHYGPHSPNRKRHNIANQKEFKKSKSTSEIDIIFEAWNLEGNTIPPVRTLIRRTLRTHLTFDDIVDEQYLGHTNFGSLSNSRYFCNAEHCYFSKSPPVDLPRPLFPLSFASLEYLNQHKRRAEHTSTGVIECGEHSSNSIKPPAELKPGPQDVRDENKLIFKSSEKAIDRQIRPTDPKSRSPLLSFPLCTEPISLVDSTTPKIPTIIENTNVPSSKGSEDSHSSKTRTSWSSFIPEFIPSPSTISPKDLGYEDNFASHGIALGTTGIDNEHQRCTVVQKSVSDFLSWPEFSPQDDWVWGFDDEMSIANCSNSYEQLTTWPLPSPSTTSETIFSEATSLESQLAAPCNRIAKRNRTPCPKCSRQFTRKSDMLRHSAKHEAKVFLICKHCPREFYRQDKLNAHERTHKEPTERS